MLYIFLSVEWSRITWLVEARVGTLWADEKKNEMLIVDWYRYHHSVVSTIRRITSNFGSFRESRVRPNKFCSTWRNVTYLISTNRFLARYWIRYFADTFSPSVRDMLIYVWWNERIQRHSRMFCFKFFSVHLAGNAATRDIRRQLEHPGTSMPSIRRSLTRWSRDKLVSSHKFS